MTKEMRNEMRQLISEIEILTKENQILKMSNEMLELLMDESTDDTKEIGDVDKE